MLVKLDHFPRDRGENQKYFKPPPKSIFQVVLLLVGLLVFLEKSLWKPKNLPCLPHLTGDWWQRNESSSEAPKLRHPGEERVEFLLQDLDGGSGEGLQLLDELEVWENLAWMNWEVDDRMIDWLSEWIELINWLFDLFDWLIDWLVDGLIELIELIELIDWSIDDGHMDMGKPDYNDICYMTTLVTLVI